MAPSSPLRVVMASTRLPPPGTNATGTPAHVRKTAAAVRALGAEVSMLEVDPGAAPQPFGWLAATARALAALRTARADVVHVHGHLAALAVLPAARGLSDPGASSSFTECTCRRGRDSLARARCSPASAPPPSSRSSAGPTT